MGAALDVIDEVLVVAGIGVLVLRQFQWRDAARMPRVGLALLAVAVVLLVQESLTSAARWTGRDAALLAAELVLTAALGAVMGTRYRFRRSGSRTEARLGRAGVGLWAVFVAVRICSFALAHAAGAELIGTSGALLLVFGVNRLVTGLVVRHRLAERPVTVADPEILRDAPH